MISSEKEMISGILADFEKLIEKKELTLEDQNTLIQGITFFLGLYNIKPEKWIHDILQDMIKFGKQSNFDMWPSEQEFSKIKQRHANSG